MWNYFKKRKRFTNQKKAYESNARSIDLSNDIVFKWILYKKEYFRQKRMPTIRKIIAIMMMVKIISL